MAKLHWDIQGRERFTTGGPIVEVAISGPDIAERARDLNFRPHGETVTETDEVLLGNFDEKGVWWDEWALQLDIDPEWVWNQMPESVKRAAWGADVPVPKKVRFDNPTWAKVFG